MRCPELKNIFCDISNLTNEASVETWFVNPLLSYLSYQSSDIKLKTSLQEFKVGLGRKSVFYKPDYIISLDNFPVLVIDAKSPDEDINNWLAQCSSYCLELNKSYQNNPVRYFIITNGLSTSLYKWDRDKLLLNIGFNEFKEGNAKFNKLISLIKKENLQKFIESENSALLESSFDFNKIPLEELNKIFQDIHQYIWTEEKKTPSAAFMELIKIIFIKLQKDKELHIKFGGKPNLKIKDVVFSKNWIDRETELDSPVSDLLFKNLIKSFEKDIRDKRIKRFFNDDTDINLSPRTIEKIVEKLEHIDLYGMDEDVNGRMFESFLDATVRGKELGQYFTPRDIVKLMVYLSEPQVKKQKIDNILDACCGSGGFLINAMTFMLESAKKITGLSNVEQNNLLKKIRTSSIYGIDAGSDPPIYRIARMNMYLHGDGGCNIYFADSLDKSIGQIGKSNIEYDEEIKELRKLVLEDNKKFDIILSNPPFSLKYTRDNKDQKAILDQYELSVHTGKQKPLNTILSSVMFLERYKDLVAENGTIYAIIDDSVLSGDMYGYVRNYIRKNFIIKGIISLPGDAFKRAAARVKTSILILRLKREGESQPQVFMAKSIYLGLSEKIAKRLGISKNELEAGKEEEFKTIVEKYKSFVAGIPGDYVVEPYKIADRLDVKYCLGDNSRKKPLWIKMGMSVDRLGNLLKIAVRRSVNVLPDEEYQLLKVNYDGEVLDAEIKLGEECSYSVLYEVKAWDLLFSNMGVGRGALGIVPTYHEGKYVSNEYTILRANSKKEAIFYTTILRTKEILGDILSSTTGMNRGRIKWNTMSGVEVPVYNPTIHNMKDNVNTLTNLWKSFSKYNQYKKQQTEALASHLELEDPDARKRWLAYKPPE